MGVLRIKIDKLFYLEALMVLLVINYMVVTIMCNDMIVLKFSRDILLLLLFVQYMRNATRIKGFGLMLFFVFFTVIGAFQASSAGTAVNSIRRYFFPLLMFVVAYSINFKVNIKRFLKFLLIFMAVISAWGIFQAYVLGDSFLARLGYPLEYSYYYKRMFLGNSFYFGGFGIQRVVATLSSSNICGLILGTSLIMLLVCYPYLDGARYRNFYILLIGLAYLLTFSRSNFLAMLIVGLLAAYPYIPKRKYFFVVGVMVLFLVLIIGIAQGTDGIVYKLVEWVRNTLTFTESSAAGRSAKWLKALNTALRHPLGIGFGHVGNLASRAGIVEEYYSCENSYLASALDVGWFGLITYYGFYLVQMNRLKNYAKSFKQLGDGMMDRVCRAAYIAMFYLLIVMFFSNHVHDMEAVGFVYTFAGIALGMAMRSEINKTGEPAWQKK